MRALIPALILVPGLLVAGCGAADRPARTTAPPPVIGSTPWPPLADAPLELADDNDLEELRARYNAMAVEDAGRVAIRRQLAVEYALRIDVAVGMRHRRHIAYERLLDLIGLWSPREFAEGAENPAALAGELAPYAPSIHKVRDLFARSGGDQETAAALLVLSLAAPGQRSVHAAELDEIFAYSDALAVAEHGPGAERARPIEILEDIVDSAAIPDAVDRLIALYIARQAAFDAQFRKSGPSARLFNAHGDGVFKTAWHIVRVLAISDRIDEALAALAPLSGIGADRRLIGHLEQAVERDVKVESWVALIDAYQREIKREEPEERQQVKLRAVLALGRIGSERLPDNPALPIAAGQAARRLGQIPLAIRFYREALRRDPDSKEGSSELGDLFRMRVSALAYQERPLAAQKQLAELEAFYQKIAGRWPDESFAPGMAEAYTTMARGMVSLGQLADANRYLEKSLDKFPTTGAYEQLGTIAFKRDELGAAIKHFDRGVDIEPGSPLDLYNQAKILRQAGDARLAAGRQEEAVESYAQALSSWMKLDEQIELPTEFHAEMLVELGKAQWELGDRERAVESFDRAVDIDQDGADTHSTVVAFLIVRGEYGAALDTYHRALGSQEINDYSKVYLSLWVLAESRRMGRVPDPLVLEFLRGRDGRLWYDQLAQYATGRKQLAELDAIATTRGRRAELLYYSAVLDESKSPEDIRALLKGVLATDMVMFYEYEMAKYWLSEGFARARATR